MHKKVSKKAGQRVEDVYKERGQRLQYMAQGIVRSPEDGEDVVQDAFLKLMQTIQGGEVRSDAALATTITRNKAIDEFRKKKRSRETPASQITIEDESASRHFKARFPDGPPEAEDMKGLPKYKIDAEADPNAKTPEEILEERTAVHAVLKEIEELPENEKTVVELTLQNRSRKEIAAILGTNEKNVNHHYHLAVKKLKAKTPSRIRKIQQGQN